ncbi:HNH endonuclease [Paenibacillus sp. 598K]|uniref:HNH endonuclease n=1 Tax=Paenibacillus sp. 598K TaxID=1117987 RepID=UPI000FFA258F|nr:HNH endonuclease signature motif containing protein [Paenibacillus sp. 598K]GBF73148.1 HNH endonuclease [Paenibacillus sp. 598K]
MHPKRKAIYDRTGGRCYYCGSVLAERGWHADHVEAIRRNWWTNTCLNPENDTEANKVPACASCNRQKGPLTVEQFREKIAAFVNSLNLYHNQYIVAKRYGLVQETGAPVTFWFERQGNDTPPEGTKGG